MITLERMRKHWTLRRGGKYIQVIRDFDNPPYIGGMWQQPLNEEDIEEVVKWLRENGEEFEEYVT